MNRLWQHDIELPCCHSLTIYLQIIIYLHVLSQAEYDELLVETVLRVVRLVLPHQLPLREADGKLPRRDLAELADVERCGPFRTLVSAG